MSDSGQQRQEEGQPCQGPSKSPRQNGDDDGEDKDRDRRRSGGSSLSGGDKDKARRDSQGEDEEDEEEEEHKFCSSCSPCAQLLREADVLPPMTPLPEDGRRIRFRKEQAAVLYHYLTVWVKKQCVCLFRDPKMIDRFCILIQHVTRFCVQQLKNLKEVLEKARRSEEQGDQEQREDEDEDPWSVNQTEMLLQFMAKIFIQMFPLYLGPKQVNHRFEDVSTAEATQLAVFCNVHDSSDFPIALLRNVTLFCRSGGLQGMASAFTLPSSLMPPSMAFALITILYNIKMWLNYRAVLQLFGPVRTNALRYMCGLSDAELRMQDSRNMADFLWTSVKENVDSPVFFDRDGLELAFKYFSSSTLAMRLAGINQINMHISNFNDMCNTESVVEVENVGLQLANWILSNKILEHIFGPNLHVEVIKQSHVLLNFLAVEGKIASEHIDVIWQAAQLKYCAKQVQDLLLPLIKNLEAGPVLHLYDLMKELPVKEHTEQTIHLAQVLQKFIWSSSGQLSNILQEASALQHQQQGLCCRPSDSVSSSEADGDSANAGALPLSAVASLAAAKVAREGQQQSTGGDAKQGRALLDRSAVDAPECDFSIQDLEDLEDLNDYSEDDDEEEEEEDDDDDDDDELASSDEETAAIQQQERQEQLARSRSKMAAAAASAAAAALTPKKDAAETARGKRSPLSGEDPGEDDEEAKMLPGKRTAGLPIKGRKRSRSDSAEGKEEKTKAVLPAAQDKKTKSDGTDSQGDNDREEAPAAQSSSSGEKAPCWWPTADGKESSKRSAAGPAAAVAAAAAVVAAAAAASGNGGRVSSPPPPSSSGNTAMAELTNLVNAHPRSAGPIRVVPAAAEVVDMRPVIRSLAQQQQQGEKDNEDSLNSESRLSDKNLGDFEEEEEEEDDDEDNSVDDEMMQLASQGSSSQPDIGAIMQQQQQQLACMASFCQQRLAASAAASSSSGGAGVSRLTARQQREEARIIANYKLDNVCEPGNTLLWDLLQDDNIDELSEGIALEAEQNLTNLLCFNMERFIRMKFIEGCLLNVSRNRSVAVSLRLLPKLIQSFQNFRNLDTHDICMFTERRHGMMRLFFENLDLYTRERREGKPPPPFFNHATQIQTRLQFLNIVFSGHVSPQDFKLAPEQVNTLWECLADDPTASDDLFQYLLMQIHSKDQHAVGLDGFRLIYEEKLGQLRPESISMLGLNVFSQLCQLQLTKRLRAAEASEGGSSNAEVAAAAANSGKMEQLWKIALCAQNTDVSMKAIQILNTVYFGQGEEFLETCMRNLRAAAQELKSGKDEILLKIQRALLLLKTYLETFRRKYAYHFRRMSIDGHDMGTHAELVDVRGAAAAPLRVTVQAGGPDRVTLDMRVLDLVADLRAEVTAWFESRKQGATSPPKVDSGSLRLLTQGQELSADMDEKSLAELGFKDMQLVLVSQGKQQQQQLGPGGAHFRQQQDSTPPFPGRERMPMNLLLLPENFDQLFALMQALSDLGSPASPSECDPTGRCFSPHPKAQILSRRVWDILMLLPTNPHIKRRLQDIGQVADEELRNLLSPASPQKLMYTFYIVDWLGRPARLRRHSGLHKETLLPPLPQQFQSNEEGGHPQGDEQQGQQQSWTQRFIRAGGLKHLFEIFASGRLQNDREKGSVWCEWKQDCLSALLKLLVQFGVDPQDDEAFVVEQLMEASAVAAAGGGASGGKKRSKRYQQRHSSGDGRQHHHLLNRPPPPLAPLFHDGRLLVPRLSSAMLRMMEADRVVPRLASVLMDASHTKQSQDHAFYRTGVFGRAQVVRFAMSLLVAWLFSAEEEAEDAFFASNGLPAWLKGLLLDDPDPAVRREVCTGLYKMCMGSTSSGRSGATCTAPLLSVLLEFLDEALRMAPQSALRRDGAGPGGNVLMHLPSHVVGADDGKEPFGPACRDYFFILCRLVDNLLTPPDQPEVDAAGLIDLDQLAKQVAMGMVARKNYEKRHGDPSPDDSLVGSLNLLGCVMKHQPRFKVSAEGQEFLLYLMECLFALPNPRTRDEPKAKSTISRTSCYDLLVELAKGSLGNYLVLHGKLLDQHRPDSHLPYQWEYWPREDGRAECGFVGLTNLGSTCYMATCMQQLFMIPDARDAVLRADPLMTEGTEGGRHAATLRELQKMFAYLRDSERKAYNPLSFCKTYQMDHQSLNNGEQRDMTEFFIDLLSKMEEMSADLKQTVKSLFGGVQTNSVVSLDCNHVSRTLEEFYTIRCQLSDRRTRNLHQSLQEVTVKDTLEGDNMYTCSQCNKKVRAEKRACFKKLPKILSLNIMRYMYNMLNMQKVEKVNTHFSFPFQLDMSPYMEKNLIPKDKEDVDEKSDSKREDEDDTSYEYELIGVTVHTGTAEGGHYYAFIRDRSSSSSRRHGANDRWYSFNDAEVKPFDPSQIGAECFGGEVNSRAYDQVTEKYMDMNIEKTNSAYMLFYERVDRGAKAEEEAGPSSARSEEEAEQATAIVKAAASSSEVCLSAELEEWIWHDNVNFIQDNNIFDHTYFNFMWQMVAHIPATLLAAPGPSTSALASTSTGTTAQEGDITLLAAKLATSFFLESFIHAKEKLNIVQWVELLTKQFDGSMAACGWFLDHMAGDTNWPMTIFLRCQVSTIRQMFQRLCIHVIQKLRAMEKSNYLLPWTPDGSAQPTEEVRARIGSTSAVTRFVRMLLALLDSGAARPHLKYLTELFRFLYDFAKMGEEEARFLLQVNAISILVDFYLRAVRHGSDMTAMGSDMLSDDDEDDDDEIIAIPIAPETNKMASLEKMVWLIALLVEKSREEDNMLHLSSADLAALVGSSPSSANATTSAAPSSASASTVTAAAASASASTSSTVVGGEGETTTTAATSVSSHPQASHSQQQNRIGLLFLYHITKDNINPCQTANLIFSLARNNPEFAEQVASMVFYGVKQPEHTMHFFHLLTLLTDPNGARPPGMPCFTSLVMHRIWDLAKTCAQAALDWLSIQVARNRYVQTWLLSTMDSWVEPYLLAHPDQKVRNSAAFLVVSLVPSQHFRTTFRSARALPAPIRETMLGKEEQEPLNAILDFLFGLLPSARNYTDLQHHGSGKLVAYLQTMSHCLLTKAEKRKLEPHFLNLWQLFHPKLSEPSIPVHHNKQALLNLWYALCVDCPENVRLILNNPHVTKNIAFNYILADHDEADVINFNRVMLPAYYGLLRMCCLQSKAFTRQLAQHQNIQWAFKNITPYMTHYHVASDELFKLMKLFVQRDDDMTEEEEAEIRTFRHQTLQLYLSILDGRSSWSTLISVLKILVETDDDRVLVVYNNGLGLVFDALSSLHMMFHEATACHVTGEIVDLLQIFHDLLKGVRSQRNNAELTQVLSRWKDMGDMSGRILTLCNSYTPPDLREICLLSVREMLMLWPGEMISILVPILHRAHSTSSYGEVGSGIATNVGPYFPRRGGHPTSAANLKAVRPPRPMLQMSVPASQLECSHGADQDYDRALHRYFNPYHQVVDLLVRLAVNQDALSKPLVDLSAMVGLDGVPLHMQLFPKLWLDINNTEAIDRKFVSLLNQSHSFLEYVDAVLLDERSSLNNAHIFKFLLAFFPRVADQVLTDQMLTIIADLSKTFQEVAGSFGLSKPGPIKQLNGDLRALLLVNTAKPDHLTPPLQFALRLLKDRVEAAHKLLEEKERQVPEINVDLKKEEKKQEVESDNSKPKQDSKEDPKAGEKRKEIEGRCDESRGDGNDECDGDSGPRPSSSKKARTCSTSTPTPGGSGTAADCKKKTEESSRLAEAYEVCLKTLGLLVQMCENKVKVQETAAALVSAQQAKAEAMSTASSSSSDEGDDDDDGVEEEEKETKTEQQSKQQGNDDDT